MKKTKKDRGQKTSVPQRHVSKRRKREITIILVLAFGVAGIVLAGLGNLRKLFNPHFPPPQSSPTPQLSKEYIYAGGKLVAIEEPTSSEGSGPAPTNLIATATSETSVSLTWAAPTGSIAAYQVQRSESVNGPYTTLAPNSTTTSFTDSTASAGIAYLYRVRAAYSGGGYSYYSDKDLATTIMFTDDPLSVNVTPIRAAHLTELRQAVNAVRAAGSLSPSTWTDASLTGMTIKGVYVEELRTSLNQALNALGLSTPPYTDASLPGTTIKKAHIEELRARVK